MKKKECKKIICYQWLKLWGIFFIQNVFQNKQKKIETIASLSNLIEIYNDKQSTSDHEKVVKCMQDRFDKNKKQIVELEKMKENLTSENEKLSRDRLSTTG